MARTDEQMNLRLPDGMRDRVRAEAKANGRSMNAEVIARLEASFQPRFDVPEEIQKMREQFQQMVMDVSDLRRALVKREADLSQARADTDKAMGIAKGRKRQSARS
ncbi:MAG: Arc family DNA-binding protein [Alphaproteobacteria bacterium]|nr:Arc family DNA-binding protein [Alphaproteobacteria bacterium]